MTVKELKGFIAGNFLTMDNAGLRGHLRAVTEYQRN